MPLRKPGVLPGLLTRPLPWGPAPRPGPGVSHPRPSARTRKSAASTHPSPHSGPSWQSLPKLRPLPSKVFPRLTPRPAKSNFEAIKCLIKFCRSKLCIAKKTVKQALHPKSNTSKSFLQRPPLLTFSSLNLFLALLNVSNILTPHFLIYHFALSFPHFPTPTSFPFFFFFFFC